MYLASVYLCRDDGDLAVERVKPERIGLFDGTSRSNFEHLYELIRRQEKATLAELYTRRELMTGLPGQTVGLAASLLKTRGPAYVFNGTCSSGAIAVGHAYREIVSGAVDVAFATGHDTSLVAPLYAMYGDANLLSPERTSAARAVRPYVEHSTNAFGEGAITLLLETREHAEARGADPIAQLAGYAYGNNGYHPTTVDVAGVRPAEVMRTVIADAGVELGAVAFVVGHGNGVHLSDVSEENYMRLVFGGRANAVPLVSTKPIYGHTLGASSSVNAAAAALMVQRDFIIPTINIDESRVKRATHHQANTGVMHKCASGVAMSYGMGGHNAALIFRAVT
jgi:3-oxoacyl-[acyl-carrier-protein] synthase II